MFTLSKQCSTSAVKCFAALATAGWAGAADAHMLPTAEGAAFNPWAIDPIAVLLLALTGWLYWRGGKRRNATRPSGRRQRREWQFWGGWLALVIALASPVDGFGEVLFSVHMVQHELLMLLAAPLLVLSRPSSNLIRGASGVLIRLVRGATGGTGAGASIWRRLLSPFSAWWIHFVGLWGWHLPALFNASLRNDWIHSLQHLSFVVIALIFWHAILRPGRIYSFTAVIYLFTTAIHASLLGALLTFSPKLWYQPYATTTQGYGLTPLQDQQLGGLIMWMPAGIAFILAALYLLARILRNEGHPKNETETAADTTATTAEPEPKGSPGALTERALDTSASRTAAQRGSFRESSSS